MSFAVDDVESPEFGAAGDTGNGASAAMNFPADTPAMALSVYSSLTSEQQALQLRPMSVQTRPGGPWVEVSPAPTETAVDSPTQQSESSAPSATRSPPRRVAPDAAPAPADCIHGAVGGVPAWARFDDAEEVEDECGVQPPTISTARRGLSADRPVGRLVAAALVAAAVAIALVLAAPQWFGMHRSGSLRNDQPDPAPIVVPDPKEDDFIALAPPGLPMDVMLDRLLQTGPHNPNDDGGAKWQKFPQ